MKADAVLLAAVMALSLACGRKKAEPTAQERKDQHAESRPEVSLAQADATEHTEAAGKDTVRIDAEMLRDLRITTATVEQRMGGEGPPVLGELRVNEDTYAEVRSPVSARVANVVAAQGARVRKGQPLAVLQSQEVGKERGEYGEAVARADLARKALERKQGLAGERIVPEREVQEAEAELRRAEASLQAERAALQALGVSADDGGDASQFVLLSPVTGTVIERSLVRGEVAESTKALFKVGNLSRLWLMAHAYERDAVRVRAGTSARIALPALPGRTFVGKVALVGSQVDVSSRTIPIRIDVTNEDGLLRPGMSATVWLQVGEGTPLVAVPAAALQRLEDKWCIFIPKGEGVFEVRPVGRGRDLGGEVEILSGLTRGETIVVEGAFLLKAEAEKAHGAGAHHDH